MPAPSPVKPCFIVRYRNEYGKIHEQRVYPAEASEAAARKLFHRISGQIQQQMPRHRAVILKITERES